MREPRIGEMLKCQTCGKNVKRVDKDWIAHFNTHSEQEKETHYDQENDHFLGYDSCEHDDKDHEEPGIKEEHRSYIRGTSYRPY